MQLNLFENKITIDNIKESDFSFFKNQKKLNLDNKYEIDNFLYDYNYENPLYYHCILEYNSCVKDFKYKYMIVEHNNDKIFIMYKVIEFMKVKSVKIIDKPFSLNKNLKNEKELIKILLEKSFVNVLFKEKYTNFYSDYNIKESVQDFDYYVDFSTEFNKSLTPKYKHKKRINRFENNKDFKVEFINEIEYYQDYLLLRKIWASAKGNVKNDKKFELFIKDKDFNKLFLNIYYQNNLIFNSCFIVKNDYLINIFESSLSKYVQDLKQDSYLKNCMAYIDDVANYYISNKFLNSAIKRSFIAGANPKHILLVDFKEKHSNGKIKYYKIDKR